MNNDKYHLRMMTIVLLLICAILTVRVVYGGSSAVVTSFRVELPDKRKVICVATENDNAISCDWSNAR